MPAGNGAGVGAGAGAATRRRRRPTQRPHSAAATRGSHRGGSTRRGQYTSAGGGAGGGGGGEGYPEVDDTSVESPQFVTTTISDFAAQRHQRRKSQGGYHRFDRKSLTLRRAVTFDDYRWAASKIEASRGPLKQRRWVSPHLARHGPPKAQPSTPGPGDYFQNSGGLFGARVNNSRFRNPVLSGSSRTSRRQQARVIQPGGGPISSLFQERLTKRDVRAKQMAQAEWGGSSSSSTVRARARPKSAAGFRGRSSGAKARARRRGGANHNMFTPDPDSGFGGYGTTSNRERSKSFTMSKTVRKRLPRRDSITIIDPGPTSYDLTHDSALRDGMPPLRQGGSIPTTSRAQQSRIHAGADVLDVPADAGVATPGVGDYKTEGDYVRIGSRQNVTSAVPNNASAIFSTTVRKVAYSDPSVQ